MRGRQSDECDRSNTPRELRHRVTGFSTAKQGGREASNSTVSVLPKDSWRRTARLEGARGPRLRSSMLLVLGGLRIESSVGRGDDRCFASVGADSTGVIAQEEILMGCLGGEST
jgi:hypothetical protein